MNQISARIISNKEIMPGIHLIRFEARDIATEAKPGQFVMVSCGEDTILPRPFSIHRCDGGSITLLVRIAGKGTEYLSQCMPGNLIKIFGPLGNGFSIDTGSKNLLLVAGGIGIAPLIFLAENTLKNSGAISLLHGAPSSAFLYPEKFLPDGIKPVVTTDDGSAGKKGLITELIPDYLDNTDRVISCGPVSMYKAMSQLPELKYKPVQVSMEIMMGCGRGICYGCTIRTKNGLQKVCEDGPVFNLNDILWDKPAI